MNKKLSSFLKKEYTNPSAYRLHQSSIPVFIPKNTSDAKSPIHLASNSHFDYLEHYEKDAKFFDYFKEYEDGATRHENRRLHEAIMSEISPENKTILDVGCGNAWVAKHLSKKSDCVLSLDVSTVNVEKAISKYPAPNHFGVVADLFSLPFKENSMDIIICAEVIEHVSDPSALIKSLLYCLKPKGTLVITTPYNEKLTYCLCVHCNRLTTLHAHLHSFTIESMKKEVLPKADKNLIGNTKMYAFSNKYMAKLRTHIFLKYFPYKLWYLIDKFANLLANKPVRLLVKIQKSSTPASAQNKN